MKNLVLQILIRYYFVEPITLFSRGFKMSYKQQNDKLQFSLYTNISISKHRCFKYLNRYEYNLLIDGETVTVDKQGGCSRCLPKSNFCVSNM